MDTSELIESAVQAATRINQITAEYATAHKGRTRGFNFFIALAAEGTHWEGYHSNFIRYLLSPKDHAFNQLFLRHFLEMLQSLPSHERGDYKQERTRSFLEELDSTHEITALREQPTDNGRVDIQIYFAGLNGILFIENKVRSKEGASQMSDYFRHYCTIDRPCLGVYLTKNGDRPPSINSGDDHAKSLITISYNNIIEWLEACCQDHQISGNPGVEACLQQYITVVKKELNIMSTEELNETVNYLLADPNRLSLLARGQQLLNEAIESAIEKSREDFLSDLLSRLRTVLSAKDHNFKEVKRGQFLFNLSDKPAFYLYVAQTYPDVDDGGKGLWWGIYDPSNKPFKSKFQLTENFWESITIDGISDFYRDNEGSAKIAQLTSKPDDRAGILNQIAQYISSKVDSNVLGVLQSL